MTYFYNISSHVSQNYYWNSDKENERGIERESE